MEIGQHRNIEPASRSKNTTDGFNVQKINSEFNIQIINSLVHFKTTKRHFKASLTIQ